METSYFFKHGYAVLVGVGGDLPVTVADATGLYEILTDPLRCAYPHNQIKLITGNLATREQILEALDWLGEQTQGDPGATAIFYFSGHGGFVPTYHLIPYGYNPHDMENTALSGIELTQKLQAICSKKLLVLLDCCHAGGMSEVKGQILIKAPMPPEFNANLARGSGKVIIASSRRDEVSYTGNPYSVFTQCLREALAGYGSSEQDGYSYVADAAMYVGRMVPLRTNNRQHPILKLAAADNFAISYYAAGEKVPKPLSEAVDIDFDIAIPDDAISLGLQQILRQYQRNLLDVEEKMSHFYDQAAIPLDLERTKIGILKKMTEIELEIQKRRSSIPSPLPDLDNDKRA